MFVCLLRSVHGYPLRAEAELSEHGQWLYVKSLCLYREEDGVFVGTLPYPAFTNSVIKVLRKRGFSRASSGWRIREGDYDELEQKRLFNENARERGYF